MLPHTDFLSVLVIVLARCESARFFVDYVLKAVSDLHG